MIDKSENWKILAGSNTEINSDYPKWFLDILANRGLKSARKIDEYLNPKYENLVSYKKIFNIDKAVERIKKALRSQEKVVVYGDYDVDGICSSVIVYETLKKIGILDVEIYIPHRDREGYGLNNKNVKDLIKSGVSLFIAVDCGINSRDVIDNNKSDFIVVDHHLIDKDQMPQKAITIHPSLNEDKEDLLLTAGGASFLLAQAIYENFPDIFPKGQEKWLLDLVALSTICDIVPLVENNRILAKWGLLVLEKTRRVGILELMKVASVNPQKISSFDVGFVLGPRLNASGRISHAQKAIDLLITEDRPQAQKIAMELNRENRKRQEICNRIVEEAREAIKNQSKDKESIIILSDKNWPKGVVGIVASRISESFNRPTIIFEDVGGEHHGSARSVDGFDITEALSQCDDYLISFGGHKKAAGLKVSEEHFVAFSEKMVTIAKDKIDIKNISKKICIDAIISPLDISDTSLDLLEKMEPFGYGNPEPIFLVKGVKVDNLKRVGKKGEHLKFSISLSPQKDSESINGIYFNAKKDIVGGCNYDLVLRLKYNFWNNMKNIEAIVIDFQESAKP